MNNYEKIIIKEFKKTIKEEWDNIKITYSNYNFIIHDFIAYIHYDIADNTGIFDSVEAIENEIVIILKDYILIKVLKVNEKNKIKFKNKFYKLKEKYFVNNRCLEKFVNNEGDFFEFSFNMSSVFDMS